MHKQSIGVGLPYFENYSYKPGHNKLCTAHVQVHIYAITKSGSSNNVTHVQYVLSNDFIICPTDGHLHCTCILYLLEGTKLKPREGPVTGELLTCMQEPYKIRLFQMIGIVTTSYHYPHRITLSTSLALPTKSAGKRFLLLRAQICHSYIVFLIFRSV